MAGYTKEQIEKASRVDLVGYLSFRGEKLVRAGSEYKLIYFDSQGQHDSISIRGNKWFDHKNQRGGNTITFLQEFYDITFMDAVNDLLNGEIPEAEIERYKANIKKEKKHFVLPKGLPDMKSGLDYLLNQRFLSEEIVRYFIERKLIYQESRFNNIVFVGTDEKGVPRSGHQKSIKEDGFKNTLAGSDKKYGFHYSGIGKRLFIFEGAVDLLSYLTLFPENWQEESYLALDGLSPKAMIHFIEVYKRIEEVTICVDHDEAGIEAFDKFKDMLVEKGIRAEKVSRLYPIYKDWNEMLKVMNGIEPIVPEQHPKIESYKKLSKILNVLNARTEHPYMKWKEQNIQKSGLDVLMKQINREYGELTKGGWSKLLTEAQEVSAMRVTDSAVTALYLYDKSQPLDIPKETRYMNTMNELKNNYKPYTDRFGMRRRFDDIKKEMDMANKAYKSQDPSLFVCLKKLADTSLRLQVYNAVSQSQINTISNKPQLAEQNQIAEEQKEGDKQCQNELSLSYC